MPLTPLQREVLAVLAAQRSEASYLAGGAALHLGATGERYSNDLDLFHHSADAANRTFAVDAAALRAHHYTVGVVAEGRGFVSATVARAGETTLVDWAHESAWRFLPLVPVPGGGVMLHPIDLAINKLVALAHRREPRDVVDVIYADRHILPFPALVWAVVEKNPGLNPASYLELFRRRTITPEDAAYLRFAGPYPVEEAAAHFRRMVAETDAFLTTNAQREPGVLYRDTQTGAFFLPRTAAEWARAREHRGALGGVVAQVEQALGETAPGDRGVAEATPEPHEAKSSRPSLDEGV
jgi:hypothetical protein